MVRVANYHFNVSQFMKLLEFAVKDNHFIFNSHQYKQIDGVTIGSSLGPDFPIHCCVLLNTIVSL